MQSCYKLLVDIPINLSSSAWRKLWQLEVLGKVKNFLWQAMVNVLLTTDNLLRKHVDSQPVCFICSASNESVFHILVDCSFTKSYWVLSAIGYVGDCASFMHWIENVFSQCSKEECNLATMICWRLWINKNDRIWNNKNGRVRNVLNSAGQNLF